MMQIRLRSVLKGSFFLTLAKVISVAVSLVVTALTARLFTDQQFGVWAIVFSCFALVDMFNKGLGMNLRNRISLYLSRKESEKVVPAFFSEMGMFALCSGVLILLASFFVFILHKPFHTEVFNYIFLFAILSGLLSLPFSLAAQTFFSYMEVGWIAFFEVLRSVFLMSFVFIAFQLQMSFVKFSFYYYFIWFFVAVITWEYFCRRRQWKVIKARKELVVASCHDFVKKGFFFMLIYASTFIIGSVDAIICGYVASYSAAGDFYVVQKMFMFLTTVSVVFLNPFWSAYTHKYEIQDFEWIRWVLKSVVWFIFVGISVVGIGFVVFGEQIVYLWTKKVVPDTWLYILFFCWALITVIISHYSMFLSGIDRIKRQGILLLIGAVINVPLSIVLGRIYSINGVILASIIVLIPLLVSNIKESYQILPPILKEK